MAKKTLSEEELRRLLVEAYKGDEVPPAEASAMHERFQASLERLRTDPAEQARVDALIVELEAEGVFDEIENLE
jgi:hypothetical protein